MADPVTGYWFAKASSNGRVRLPHQDRRLVRVERPHDSGMGPPCGGSPADVDPIRPRKEVRPMHATTCQCNSCRAKRTPTIHAPR